MGSGKRASMREGPLAALFRKTETEGMGPAEPPAQPPAPPERTAPRTPTPITRSCGWRTPCGPFESHW